MYVGSLQKINNFYLQLETELNCPIKEVNVKGKILKRDDERTFSCIGIRNDFICNIKYIDDIEYEENRKKKNIKIEKNCSIM